jgi:hypothetical protein
LSAAYNHSSGREVATTVRDRSIVPLFGLCAGCRPATRERRPLGPESWGKLVEGMGQDRFAWSRLILKDGACAHYRGQRLAMIAHDAHR